MRIWFYATRNDLLELLGVLEAKHELFYVLEGNFLIDEPIISLNSLIIPDLGTVPFGNCISNPYYLVCSTGSEVTPKIVSGGLRYVIDNSSNLNGLRFQPSGKYGDEFLVQGETFNYSDHGESLLLGKSFAKEIKKRFNKIGYAHVGREAESLLDKGWRLVQSINSPSYLTRPKVVEYENRNARLSYLKSCQFLVKHEIGGCEDLFQLGWDGEREPPTPDQMPLPHDSVPAGVCFFRAALLGDDGTKLNMENLSLHKTLVCRSELSHVSLVGTDLTDSFMCWNDFISVNFTSSVLIRSDMRASAFVGCDFSNANLTKVDFRHSSFKRCKFSKAEMHGCKISANLRTKLKLTEDQTNQVDWCTDTGEEPPGG